VIEKVAGLATTGLAEGARSLKLGRHSTALCLVNGLV
jgi:hypothetical protein